MTTDAKLIEIIEAIKAPVLAARQKALQGVPADGASYWELTAPLREAMDAHPEFGGMSHVSFLGKQISFYNHHQALNLVLVSTTVDTAGALAWYRRVRATTRTPMRLVGELHGVAPSTPVALSNGVQLVPLVDLPPSPQAASLKASTRWGPATFIPSGVVVELGEIAAEDNDTGHQKFLGRVLDLKRTIAAFTLHHRATPSLGSVWLQFNDPELQAAEFGVSWSTARQDGRHEDHPTPLDADMLDWVERYLALPKPAADALEFPLARLNLARRRVTARDKTVDVCVAMEALLSGKQRGELTQRLAIRTALLLATDLPGRKSIAGEVRKLYELRSKLVHEGAAAGFGDDPKEAAIANRGLELCRDALRAIVRSGVEPTPADWELTGGPPFSRYAEPPTPE